MDVIFGKKRKYTVLLFLILIFFVFNFYCSKKTEPDQVVLAKVGDKVITAEEFRYNYEFGLPHLKTGANPKATYLNYMIKEKLLTMAGVSLGLDQVDRIQQLERELTEELLVEQLFIKEVDEKVAVTSQEIEDAIAKSKVKWKLNYWIEPSLDYASSVCQAMKMHGYGPVVDQIMQSNKNIKLDKKDFETDYLTWLDVPPELLNAVKDLPVGNISDPVELNGAYFIFQVVDILQEPLSEYEIRNKTHSYKNILQARKAKKKAAEFVSNFMTPKNVVTSGGSFLDLANALIEWKNNSKDESIDFKEAVLNEKDQNSALYKLNKKMNETLVTFQNGEWTISDFLDRFNEKSIKIDPSNIKGFREALNQQIALKVRNQFFVDEARKQGLDKNASFKSEQQNWRDKWIYQEARGHYMENLTVDEKLAEQYFLKYKDKFKANQEDEPTFAQHAKKARRDAYKQRALAILDHKADSLKIHYPVSINEAVLDTISVIDFQKSKGINMQAFKRSSGRLARPIVDPAWIY